MDRPSFKLEPGGDSVASFGRLDRAERVTPGPAFRLALLGDFSGRAGAGVVETGAALASRKPIRVDVDNFDQVIARLKPKVTIDLGEGAVSLEVGELDDFHPDQLVDKLEFFEQLADLRRNLQSKGGFDRAAKEVLSWAGAEPIAPAKRKSGGGAIAVDRKLSDFARLTGRKPAGDVETDDLIKRLVGPYVVPARDSRQDALVARVDEALSAAMRRVLHSPEFQTAEALWRSVDLLVRRIETDTKMQIVLYDVSADELASDLAAHDALDESALYSLLIDQPAMDANQGALTVVAGLYQWELTPPHAELLGRMAKLCALAGAPFVSSIGPDALREKPEDWHPLTKQAWDGLRGLPASHYLALATPRFLMRMPYGKRTDPIDAFAFEEFTRSSGLSGMLWGNPAVLVSLCLAETWIRDGSAMKPGQLNAVDDLPVYVYVDQDGDQIALPCTERMFNERAAVQVTQLGVIPVVSLRGRPEVRVASFTALSGEAMAGRWKPVAIAPEAKAAAAKAAAAEAEEPAKEVDTSDLDALMATLDTAPAVEPAPQAPAPEAMAPEQTAPSAAADDLDALLAGLDAPAPAPEPAPEPAASADDDLDALLASLGAAEEKPPAAENETDSELDALLASLK